MREALYQKYMYIQIDITSAGFVPRTVVCLGERLLTLLLASVLVHLIQISRNATGELG